MDLIFQGSDAIEWVNSGYSGGNPQNVQIAVDVLAGRATVAFGLSALLFGLAVGQVLRRGEPTLAWVLFVGGPVGLIGFAPLLASGSAFSKAPTVEHHEGLLLALSFAVGGMLANAILLRVCLRTNHLKTSLRWWAVALGLIGITAAFLTALYISDENFNNDPRWTRTDEIPPLNLFLPPYQTRT